MFENIKKIFGYKYLLNKNTGEIHNLDSIKIRCRVDLMSAKNKLSLNKNELDDLLVDGKYENKKLNGCRYCNPILDIDKRRK